MNKSKTFLELQEADTVTFAEFYATCFRYANGGGAIFARVAIEIMNGLGKLSNCKLNHILRLCYRGQFCQQARGCHKDAHEWDLLRNEVISKFRVEIRRRNKSALFTARPH